MKYEYTPAAVPAGQPALDPFANMLRVPEFFGRFGDVNHRYVGGANPPWTAYDTDNLFLAQVGADGTVYMPSFVRGWIPTNNNAAGFSAADLYTTMRPHGAWHPGFANRLPDSDTPLGPDVKNLEFGPGMAIPGNPGRFFNNDSIWMDFGFPVMTAPNGKRFKPLFAPLIMDLSNRLHLWAHGNRIGQGNTHVSNRGYGPPEVNLGLALVPPTDPQAAQKAAEVQLLKDLRYGGAAGTGGPAGSPRALRPGPFFAPHDFDGLELDPITRNPRTSSKQLFTGFATTSVLPNVTPAQNTMTVTSVVGTSANGFPWAIQPGMKLGIDVGANFEWVIVASVNPAANTFTCTANFTRAHNLGTLVTFNIYYPFPVHDGNTAVGPFPGVTQLPSGWDNVLPTELTNRPLGFDLFNARGTNRTPLPASHMEAFLRYGGTNAPATTSEIFRRMPKTFDNTPAGTRARNLVTLHNWHLDRISASPVIPWDPNTAGHYLYNPPADAYPKIVAAIPAPNYGTPSNLPANSEYSIEPLSPTAAGYGWRSTLGNALRVNLNRNLTDYPPLTVAGVIDPTVGSPSRNQLDLALAERQNFALEIYRALIRATGAQDPNSSLPANVGPGSADYKAARWLAQLAVNIVDYIDNDDYATPFFWNAQAVQNFTNAGATLSPEFVYGTELPRLVINEAYGRRDNILDKGKGGGKSKGKPKGKAVGQVDNQDINLFVELHNPFVSQISPVWNNTLPYVPGNLVTIGGNVYECVVGNTGIQPNLPPLGPVNWRLFYPRDNNIAKLEVNGTPAYTIEFCVSNVALTTKMRDPDNNLGELDPNSAALAATVMDWPAGAQVLPASGALSDPTKTNKGFYVVGPPAGNIVGGNPLPTSYESAWMSLSLENSIGADRVTVLLRRLACPHLPPQPNPAVALYNPYTTVDYLDNIPIADFREDNGKGNPNNVVQPAFGRRHPYSAFYAALPAVSQVVPQNGGMGNEPPNTFFQQNSPSDAPYAWLTHLDRQLVNPLELLHVSGYKPHELTQQFIVFDAAANRQAFRHYAPWGDPAAGIFRALELLGTPSNMAGTALGGRVPGNINLNTMMEPEILRALADAQNQPYANYTQADVDAIFVKLIQSRHNAAGPNTPPTSDGKPLRSFAAGNINDTFSRVDPTNAASTLFAVGTPANHPYQRAALLQKVFNNVSTTSNVFAVWVTVGFFEVVDESVRPVKLGAEIGREQNAHIRHRLFSIIDRSGLTVNRKIGRGAGIGGAIAAGANQTVTLGDPTGLTQPWVLRPGMWVEVQAGTASEQSEVVQIKQVVFPNPAIGQGVANVVADFAYPHPGGATFILRGNPGSKDGRRQVNTATAPAVAIPVGADVNITVLALGNITPGMTLSLGGEPVFVKTVNAATNSFTADVTVGHAASTPVTLWQPNYNPRQDTDVVLHLSVIQ
jgi:hypothetical protein